MQPMKTFLASALLVAATTASCANAQQMTDGEYLGWEESVYIESGVARECKGLMFMNNQRQETCKGWRFKNSLMSLFQQLKHLGHPNPSIFVRRLTHRQIQAPAEGRDIIARRRDGKATETSST